LIHRLPAISICAFSTIVVALPIAMLLNTFTAEVGDATEPKSVQRTPAQAVMPSTPAVNVPDRTGDGSGTLAGREQLAVGDPVVKERVEKIE
jgi:hypothetical protein